MGPDGSTHGAILCKNIPYAMRSCVGSWMLHPERHVIEGIFGGFVAMMVAMWLFPRLKASVPKDHVIQHPSWAPLCSLICMSIISVYKGFGYPNRFFYFVMPCNMQWVLSVIQCYVIPTSWTVCQHTLLQIRFTYLMSVVIAIVTPETEDCVMFGEYAFYWINHILLLLLPAAYISNGSVSCFSPTVKAFPLNFYWWLYSCSIFWVFYYGPVTVMAVHSGLNLNFMMHPPMDHFVLKGPNYRLVATAALAAAYVVSRLLCIAYEKSTTYAIVKASKSIHHKAAKEL